MAHNMYILYKTLTLISSISLRLGENIDIHVYPDHQPHMARQGTTMAALLVSTKLGSSHRSDCLGDVFITQSRQSGYLLFIIIIMNYSILLPIMSKKIPHTIGVKCGHFAEQD